MNYITNVALWQEGRAGRRIRDLTGQRFGRLTVLGMYPKDIVYSTCRHKAWYCLCDCGKNIVADGASLVKGTTVSCGCAKKERCPEIIKKRWEKYRREKNKPEEDTAHTAGR